MNPPVFPELEFWTVFKWIAILMIVAGLMKLAGLFVMQWWYGKEKHSRRADDPNTRGWLDRFLELQQVHTSEIIKLREETAGVRHELSRNGDAIRDLAESWKCNYQGWSKRDKGRDENEKHRDD